MKTKCVPAVVMLLAGFFTCIIAGVQHMETTVFLRTLFTVLIVFYILGCVIKVILDKNFKLMDKPEEKQTDSEQNETESEEQQEKSESEGE